MSLTNRCPTTYYMLAALALGVAVAQATDLSADVCSVADQKAAEVDSYALLQQERVRGSRTAQQLLRGGSTTLESPALHMLEDVRLSSDSGPHPAASLLLLQEVEPLAQKESITEEEGKHVLELQELAQQILLPGLKEALSEGHREVEISYQSILDCQRQVSEKLAYVSSVEDVVSHRRSSHQDCRLAESDAFFIKEKVCDEFNTFNIGLHIPADMPPNKDPQDMEEYLKLMSEYFGPLYDVYEEKHQLCEEAVANQSDISAQCWKEQAMFEESVCTLRTEMSDSCSSYDGCWTSAIRKYEDRKGNIEMLQAKHADEIRGLKKLMCLVQVWDLGAGNLTANSTQVQQCAGHDWNATNLVAQYPDVPKPITCDKNKVRRYPCADDFLGVEYKSLELHDDVFTSMKEQCRQCAVVLPTADSTRDGGKWILVSVRQQDGMLTKVDGQKDAYDAYAVSRFPNVGSISAPASDKMQHVRFGLTADPEDGPDFAAGHYFELMPLGLALIGMGNGQQIQIRESAGDHFSLTLAGSRMVARQNDQVVNTWAMSSPAPLHAKVWIKEMGASAVLSNVTTRPVQYFDLTSGEELIEVDLPCGGCPSAVQVPEDDLHSLQGQCETAGGSHLRCGCMQVLCTRRPSALVRTVEEPMTVVQEDSRVSSSWRAYGKGSSNPQPMWGVSQSVRPQVFHSGTPVSQDSMIPSASAPQQTQWSSASATPSGAVLSRGSDAAPATALQTVNDHSEPSKKADINLSLEQTSAVAASSPAKVGTYFDLTQGAEEVSVAMPCDSCTRKMNEAEWRLWTACKDVAGDVVLCGCFQVLCSKHVVAAVEG